MSHPDTCDCSRCDPSPEFFQQPSATSINKLVGEAKFKVAFHLRESQEQGACHSLVFDNENTLFRDEDQELNLVHSLEDEVRFILIDTIRRFECKKEYFNYLEVEVAFKEFERHCRLQRPLPVRLSLFLIAAVGDFTSSIETRGKQEIRDRYLSKHVTEDDIREYVKIGYDHFGFFCAGLSWLNSVVRVSWDHDLRLTRACSEGIIHPTGDTEEEKPEKLNIAPMVPTNANACSRVSPEKSRSRWPKKTPRHTKTRQDAIRNWDAKFLPGLDVWHLRSPSRLCYTRNNSTGLRGSIQMPSFDFRAV
ncbi:hypothetical protein N7468_009253 [Penicillium chermesinum]|uniref:Uncharacterized protein n=1 Tax=Penicillium chermesinum TaxID=63820 RepID=A0A9W9NHD3_9EURO|nr:uncharacterized protein N7468_009253 [Penicillium chermesinum]KAJ5220049.1 hypothetical protein N7468_009253 [Penicillium chermesinum]